MYIIHAVQVIQTQVSSLKSSNQPTAIMVHRIDLNSKKSEQSKESISTSCHQSNDSNEDTNSGSGTYNLLSRQVQDSRPTATSDCGIDHARPAKYLQTYPVQK